MATKGNMFRIYRIVNDNRASAHIGSRKFVVCRMSCDPTKERISSKVCGVILIKLK